MAAEMQKLAFKNVVSRHVSFDKKNTQMAIEDFLRFLVEVKKATLKGPFFYTIVLEPTNDPVQGILSIPIAEDYLEIEEEDELFFQTYFYIDQMIMKKVEIKDKSNWSIIEKQSKKINDELLSYIIKNRLKTLSPYYTLIREAHNKTYLEIYISAVKKEPEGIISAILNKVRQFLSKEGVDNGN